jgi:L-amino acid N-acyltransferase YncA
VVGAAGHRGHRRHRQRRPAALHRRFGFTHAGLLSGVGRKHGRWIDTLLMQKELEPRGPTR